GTMTRWKPVLPNYVRPKIPLVDVTVDHVRKRHSTVFVAESVPVTAIQPELGTLSLDCIPLPRYRLQLQLVERVRRPGRRLEVDTQAGVVRVSVAAVAKLVE